MRKRIVSAVIVLLVAATGLLTTATDAWAAYEITFTRDTTSSTGGDADATATGTIRINVEKRKVCYDISWTNLDGNVTAILARSNASGFTGSLGFLIANFPSANGTKSDCIKNLTTAKKLEAAKRKPGDHAVHISDTSDPNGALRAQLRGDQAAVPVLNGASEVPPVVTAATGSAYFTFDPQTNKACWRVAFSGLSGPVTLAHIHDGEVGADGSPVVDLVAAPSPMTGCVKDPDADAIVADIDGFYVNLHTSANGGGEIRGQLAP